MATTQPQQSPQGLNYLLAPDLVLIKPGESVRFAVADPGNGLHSAFWWAQIRNTYDIQLGTRNGTLLKFAFHKSGKYRFEFTSESGATLTDTGDRVLQRYQAAAHVDGPLVRHIASVIVPTFALHANPEPPLAARDAVSIWPRIADGAGIRFDLLLRQPGGADVAIQDRALGFVAQCNLRDGASFAITAIALSSDADREFLAWTATQRQTDLPGADLSQPGFTHHFAAPTLNGIPTIIDLGDVKPA